MLMPKKVKYRKQMRGRRKGKAWRGGTLSFGEYGLKAMENAWITDRQIKLPAWPSRASSSAVANSGSGFFRTSLSPRNLRKPAWVKAKALRKNESRW